ncbi:hypothetical protein Q5P01_007051 [Channa striata]|uniref:Ig-like domain-containing protein n=1 Tax=Channa striata TaxID=64152 RepID=A0AA88N398_CHASR|nr:hypothetical protein Q5P01_007051 [Channa striata]
MKIHPILFLCFLSALMDPNGSITIHRKKEGTNFKIQWQIKSSESWKFLCRNDCKDGVILINTTENRAENGSYSIEYTTRSSPGGVLQVNIKNLTKSDSGRYRCGVGNSPRDFEVKVIDAQGKEINIHIGDEGGTASVACYFPSDKSTKFFCQGECKGGKILINTTKNETRSDRYSITYAEESVRKRFLLRAIITQLNMSDSGRYTCGLGESLDEASIQEFDICVTDNPSKPGCTLQSDPSTSTSTTHALFLTLVICLPVAVVLVTVVLLSLQRLRETKASRRNKDVTLLAVTYENEIFQHSHSDGQSIDEEAATV